MSVLNIEPTCFKSSESNFKLPSFFGIFGFVERDNDLQFRFSLFVFSFWAQEITQLIVEIHNAVIYPTTVKWQIRKQPIGFNSFSFVRLQNPKVLADADIIPDTLLIQVFDPLFPHKLAICGQTIQWSRSKQINRSINSMRSLVFELPNLGNNWNNSGK